jgi:spermidine dehydrogenase
VRRASDRDLGMHRPIGRRDFLNGMALGSAGLLAGPRWLAGLDLGGDGPPGGSGAPYPPALTGLRGSHEGSYEVAHALRDGTFWAHAGPPEDTGEEYDLVIVGAGLSGLSAAHFFLEMTGGSRRVLVLDNHDDFGGHARRNEFTQGGRLLVGYGGSYAIESAAPYSAVARALVDALGIDVTKWERSVDWSIYRSQGMGSGFFFDEESFGADRLVPDPLGQISLQVGAASDPWDGFLQEAPVSDRVRSDLRRLLSGPKDPYPGLSSADKKARLARVSYADLLTRVLGCDEGVLPVFLARTHSLYGAGIDAVPAQDAWGLGFPGFRDMGLDPSPGPGMNLDAIPYGEAKPYFFHFPDGNATLARLLVRGLVPDSVPGHTAEDIVTAPLDYGRLDEPGAPVRIRLGSTVVGVEHAGDPAAATHVNVSYVEAGRLRTVHGRRSILACWNQVIPYICPALPPSQKEALASATKVPLVSTNVLVRDFHAFVKLGYNRVHAPHGYYSSVGLDLPVSVGDYHCPRDPGEPIVVHLGRAACRPGLPIREQHIAGRVELLQTTFETHEREIRAQLARLLAPGGFDPARDILAITVNRWPHGYAYQYNSLFDDFWLTNEKPPCVRARQPFGLVAIANSDSAAYAYADAAMDEAFRAVQEILPRRG